MQSFLDRSWKGLCGLLFVLTVTFYARQMTAWTRWQEWSLQNIRYSFDLGAGEDRIHPEVLKMRKLAMRSTGKEFALHGELKEDQWIRYPAHEFLYPIRISDKSPFMFSKKGDEIKLTQVCRELDIEGEVILYECT